MTSPSMQGLASAFPGDDMQRATTFLGSSIGRKVVMAVTGLVLYGFVVGHMIGNLQIYLGPEAINHYGVFLREFLHGTRRSGSRAAALLAGGGAARLGGRRARRSPTGARAPSATASGRPRESTYASRTMVWSGPILAALRLLPPRPPDLGSANPDFVPGDVYRQRGRRLLEPLRLRVLHPRDAGARAAHVPRLLEPAADARPRPRALGSRCGTVSLALAGIVVLGNISIPLAVLAGIVR